MDVGVYSYPHGDPLLIDKIVNEFLSQGKFDKLRKECMSDADTKPAYQNLQQRVETTVTQFLKKQVWRPDLNKNQLRDSLRKHILESGFFDAGINRIVDQVVNPNVLATVFLPEVEEVVYNYLSIPRPVDKTQRKVPSSVSEDDTKPSVDGHCEKELQHYNNKNLKVMGQEMINDIREEKLKDGIEKNLEASSESTKMTFSPEFQSKETEPQKSQILKTEIVKLENEDVKTEGSSHSEIQGTFAKMEIFSDESQESLSQIGVEKLQINEGENVPLPDSDDSVPLEINERTLSESQDSDDSIMNQMSPISQGRLTPELLEEVKDSVGEKVEMKEEKKDEVEKKPLSFIGRIPKLKREDSESSKSSKVKEDISKKDKLDIKNIYSSDESDSTRSFEKSDSDDRKGKDKKKDEKKSDKNDKKHREDSAKSRKYEDHHKSSIDNKKDRKNYDDKYKDSKYRKRSKSRDRSSNKKSSSSSSSSSSSHAKDKVSTYHKSSHQSHHKTSKSKDNRQERKRKEDEKKRSKTTDDHCKERSKKEDRRSTDRDSNERERDKTTGSRSQGENRKREKEDRTDENRGQKSQKEEENRETEFETTPKSEGDVGVQANLLKYEEVVKENENISFVNNIDEVGVVTGQEVKVGSTEEIFPGVPENSKNEGAIVAAQSDFTLLDFNELYRKGVLTKYKFPTLPDDYYVKFNSTGFKYFEEWEQNKLDCEEEFKEFVDEAENNLSLLSDDESDIENDLIFEEENRKIIYNSMEGLGNFRKSLMFDPVTTDFYKWTNNKYYQEYRKKIGVTQSSGHGTENNESEESKENIDRNKLSFEDSECQEEKNKENQERERKTLYLKLINKYKRRLMRPGQQKRRLRKSKAISTFGGIKEKNDNQNNARSGNRPQVSETEYLFKEVAEPENRLLAPTLSGIVTSENGFEIPKIVNKSESNSTTTIPSKSNSDVLFISKKTDNCGSLTPGSEMEAECPNERLEEGFFKNNLEGRLRNIFTEVSGSLEDDQVFLESSEIQKKRKRMKLGLSKRKSPISPKSGNLIAHKFNLPLSPDSDDINTTTNGVVVKDAPIRKRKKSLKLEAADRATPKKQMKRNYHQKYESQDLYKPRPILNTTRTRKRDRGLETESNSLEKKRESVQAISPSNLSSGQKTKSLVINGSSVARANGH